MKVLLISVTCGQGHNSTAKAIMNKLSEYEGVECKFLDAFEHINHILAKALDDGYQFSTKYFADPYAKAYRHFEKRSVNPENPSTVKLISTLLASKLRGYIEEYDPDVIITTHCFPAAMITILKEKGIIHSTNIGIVTDFTVHPFWEESLRLDYIVTPSELMDIQLIKKGFNKSQIVPIGIPIDPKFSKEFPSKCDAREALGLARNKFTILLMSGSMGYGHIENSVKLLNDIDLDCQLIIVCGSNAEAKEKINCMQKSKKMLVLGYVGNIEELMSASDCIITKPGGLTTSEALAMNLPLIIANPIPGQEDRNSEFLLNNGAAMMISETCPLDEVMYQLLNNKTHLESMRNDIARISHPNSTKELCDFVFNSMNKE